MPNQFVARNGIFAQGDSQVTGSTILSGSLLELGNVGFGQNYTFPGVWSAGGALITARYRLAGAGTQNAGLAFGGFCSGVLSCTEEYDGTSWTAGGALSTARYILAGAGTQNAGLAFGGYYPVVSCTEEYNGTSWSSGGALIDARYGLGGAGTQNAGLAFGGGDQGLSIGYYSTCTEEYDGISWTAGGALNNATYGSGGAGTQNAALSIGGRYTYCCTEEYDGSSWSTGGALSSDSYLTATGGTSQTDAFTAGGPSANTLVYDGTVWTNSGILICLRGNIAGAGSKNAGLAFGGYPTTYPTTEEYSPGYNGYKCTFNYDSNTGNTNITGSFTVGCDYETSPLQAGVWTSAAPLNTGRSCLAGVGIQNEALAFGGRTAPSFVDVSCTEEFNGPSWSTGGAMITARRCLAGAGTQNAALAFGGYSPSTVSCTEEYDGTSWSSGGALINARSTHGGSGTGTQNAALAFGGTVPGIGRTNCTEEYDGSTWSAGGAMITARCYLAGAGTQNAGLAFGGNVSNQLGQSTCTEHYNGTVWVTKSALIIPRSGLSGNGYCFSTITIGGSTSPYTEYFNGTLWSIESPMLTSRSNLAIAGSGQGALAFGGGFSANTERYNCTNYGVPFCAFNYSSGSGDISINSFYNTGIVSRSNLVLSSKTSTTSIGGCCLNLVAPIRTDINTQALNIIGQTSITGSTGIGGSTSISGSVSTLGDVGMCACILGGAGAWSTGGNLITVRGQLPGIGTQNSALAASGRCVRTPNTTTTDTEEYDGSTWSAGGAVITARYGHAGIGTQNSALIAGGNTVGPVVTCTEEYNGSSWSTGGALIQCRFDTAGGGTQNEGLVFGGATPAALSCTEEYDGATWSTGGALILSRRNISGAGTQNVGLAMAGFSCGPSIFGTVTCTEEYDGSTWSAGGALILATDFANGGGIQNSAFAAGGRSGTCFCTQEYDGSAWSAGGALSFGRYAHASAGESRQCGLVAGGFSPSTPNFLSATEEYDIGFGIAKTFDYSGTTGITTVSCLIETSAQRYKDNVKELNSQLDKINQLKPVEFDWKNSRRHDIGFIAEDVANVYPEVVNKNEAGEVEGISYSKMVAALVKAMQEQQQQIADLTREFNNLKNSK